MAYTKSKIKDLVDGTIDRDTLHTMLSTPKDGDRFVKYIEVLQEQVPWSDKIILPLGPKLYIVQRASDKKWVVKSHAGYEFCDWRENWKLHAVMRVRETPEEMEELYPRLMAPTTSWQVLREYYCPVSGDLLDVEAPTPWYPVIHDFEPDIDAFYSDWLGLAIPERAN